MKAAQLREQTPSELRDKEKELAEQLFVLRLHQVTGQLEKPSKVGEVKRDLARVLTVLREKEGSAADESRAAEQNAAAAKTAGEGDEG